MQTPPNLQPNKRPWPEPASSVPAWTPSEAQALYQFLHSPTGRRVGLMLQVQIAEEISKAMHQTEAGAWQRGYTRGLEGALAFLNALSLSDAAVEAIRDDRPSDNLHWLDPSRGHEDNEPEPFRTHVH